MLHGASPEGPSSSSGTKATRRLVTPLTAPVSATAGQTFTSAEASPRRWAGAAHKPSPATRISHSPAPSGRSTVPGTVTDRSIGAPAPSIRVALTVAAAPLTGGTALILI